MEANENETVPDGVVTLQTDPLRDGSVGLGGLSQLELQTERLVGRLEGRKKKYEQVVLRGSRAKDNPLKDSRRSRITFPKLNANTYGKTTQHPTKIQATEEYPALEIGWCCATQSNRCDSKSIETTQIIPKMPPQSSNLYIP